MKRSTISQAGLCVVFAVKSYDLVGDLSSPMPQWRLWMDIAVLIACALGIFAERRAEQRRMAASTALDPA